MKLRSLLIFLFLIVSLSSSILGGLLFYFSNSIIAINNKSQSLLAIAESRAENIKTYFNMEIDKLKLISSRTQLKIDVANYLKDPGPELKEVIRDKLSGSKNAVTDYKHICFIDMDGEVVTCDDLSLDGQDFSQEDFFVNGKIKEGVYFFDHVSESQTEIVTSGPISPNGKLMGVIVTFEGFDELGEIVKNRSGLKETGEVLIAYQNKETGQIIYPFPKLFTTTTTTTTGEPIKQALFGNESIFTNTLDYRKVPVVAVSQYIDIADMGLVAKMDISEVTGEYKTALVKDSIIFGLIGLLLSFIIGFILAYFISKPLDKLTEGSEIVGKGNLDYVIDIKTNDEFGKLAQAFNKMVSSVKESRASVDRKVFEQTKDIQEKSIKLDRQSRSLVNILEDVEIEKEKIDTILHSIGDAVFVVDSSLNIILVNEATENISGFSAAEMKGNKYSQMLNFIFEETGKINDKFIKEAFKIGKVQEMTNHTMLVRKDGAKISVSDSAAPIKDKSGRVTGCVVVFRDVTREREIDRAKTEFVSLASHQLRTPLTTIRWYSEMMLNGDTGEINDKQRKFLVEINKGNQRMVDLVDALLNVSRIEMGTFIIEPFPTDLKELAKSVLGDLKPLIEKKKTIIKENYGTLIGKIGVDPKLLRMVLLNLFSNAVKYTSEKGTVLISIEKKDSDILIKVADNGCGIPKSSQSKIFTKLFRADNAREKDPDGNGLGLYIVKSVMDNSGGKVWFESQEGKGTTFYVLLPQTGMKGKVGTRQLI
jgi:PAS domain S-box-containing protein